MNYTLPVVWGLLLGGLLFAVFLGRKWRKPFAIAMGIGMFMFSGLNAVLAACVEAKLCRALGDSGIVYTLYPLLAIPVFWVAARLAIKRSS
jgi:uncharacterized membrane protein YbjE (DUF340 family)